MQRIDNFKTIIEKYDIIFFDAFGVLKNYTGLVKGIERTFEYLAEQGKEYYIVTNDASRSPEATGGIVPFTWFKRDKRRQDYILGHAYQGVP